MDSVKKINLSMLLSMIKAEECSDEAFAELLERYNPLLTSRVKAYGFSGANAEEAMQEARLAMHSAALTYDLDKLDDVTFGLYAGVCISNRLKSLLRKNSRDSQEAESISEADRIPSGHDLESYIATIDLCDRVMRAAKKLLSEFEFEVFRLGFERYTTKDIAESLGKSAKSVDNAKWRISKRLSESREIADILPRQKKD